MARTALVTGRLGLTLLIAFGAATPAPAQTLQETKDAMEMMVGSAAICSDYLARPQVLEDMRQTGREQLGKAGMSEGEADAFMDDAVKTALADTSNETQKQVACEIVNIQALPQ